MDDERQPLLTNRGENFNQNGSSDDSTASTSSFNLTSVKIQAYGTNVLSASNVIPKEERITYSWKDINVYASVSSARKKCTNFFKRKQHSVQKKHILKNVCGVAYPGELLAILGSSGAGKTTLLNTLTFQNYSSLSVSGVRYLNGVPTTLKQLISQSGYVQQEDLFIGNLTVKEHLVFQALVRMDKTITYKRRMQRVDEVMADLGLTKCKKTQIGIVGRIKGISGGEKKRLSFASEVLTNPKLLFCDEPTSGLDSFMAHNVVSVLKNIAMTGKTVICTIHQPSSELYTMFDKILLMSEGRNAFLGTPLEAEKFFKELNAPCPRNYNPADYFIQLLAIVPEKEESCRQAVNLICDKFERSEIGVRVALEAAGSDKESGFSEVSTNGKGGYRSPYKASCWQQFRAVLWRSWLTIIALIIGAIYYDQTLNAEGVMNINGAIFVLITNMTFQNVFAVINVFCAEQEVFLREHRYGMYRPCIYFICKTIAELPIFIITPIIMTVVCYFMIGLNTEGYRFFIACGILVLVANVSTSFGYMISCFSTSVQMALAMGPSLIIPFLLFGGFFLNINSIPFYFKWIAYLSWFRYSNEALMINQWRNVTEIECPVGFTICPKNGQIILESLNFDEANFFWDIVMLVVIIYGFKLVAYLALLLKTCRRR